MEFLNEFYGLISEKEFVVPLWEITVFVVFISFCLLLGRHRLGLLTTYCFVFYWGFIANVNEVVSMFNNTSWGMPLYVLSGFMMVFVAITGFWLESRN